MGVEQQPWHLPRTVSELVVTENGDHVGPGPNRLIIDRRSGYLSSVLAQTTGDRRYELQIAFTLDGRQWGAISSATFTMPPDPITKPEVDDPLRPLIPE